MFFYKKKCSKGLSYLWFGLAIMVTVIPVNVNADSSLFGCLGKTLSMNITKKELCDCSMANLARFAEDAKDTYFMYKDYKTKRAMVDGVRKYAASTIRDCKNIDEDGVRLAKDLVSTFEYRLNEDFK